MISVIFDRMTTAASKDIRAFRRLLQMLVSEGWCSSGTRLAGSKDLAVFSSALRYASASDVFVVDELLYLFFEHGLCGPLPEPRHFAFRSAPDVQRRAFLQEVAGLDLPDSIPTGPFSDSGVERMIEPRWQAWWQAKVLPSLRFLG